MPNPHLDKTLDHLLLLAPGEYTAWEKRVWRRGFMAAYSGKEQEATLLSAIVRATSPEEEQAACKALAKYFDDDLQAMFDRASQLEKDS